MKQVKIVENKELVTEWNLVPEAKPDTYISGKNTKSRNIKIVTDIDSLEINLKPKQEFDFIILISYNCKIDLSTSIYSLNIRHNFILPHYCQPGIF